MKLDKLEVSFNGASQNRNVGYGGAGYGIVTSLQELGFKVPWKDPNSPIGFNFCPPPLYHKHNNTNQYKINLLPWESTELPHGWLDQMNTMDEVWATSDWVADVFNKSGVKPPIYTYEHGLENFWTPKERHVGDTIKFLHIGLPAFRKGGQITVDAFRAVFGDREDVHLTLKVSGANNIRSWYNGHMGYPQQLFNNVSLVRDMLSQEELQELYHSHDVLIYPSYGEGFGYIPLQGLATGMPTICPGEWAPYQRFLGPLELKGTWNRSVWYHHPGNVFYPSYEELCELIEYSFQNIHCLHKHYYQQANNVKNAYRWEDKTRNAFSRFM